MVFPDLNLLKVSRKFGKLIIGKTTGDTARWLYRLLKRYCEEDIVKIRKSEQ